mgnify:FL=1
MTMAFVLGNGRSRLAVKTQDLGRWGTVYGCNAIYRDFLPTVLVSTDTPISARIQEQQINQRCQHYTRRPLPLSSSQRIPPDYWGFSSGPAAAGIACDHGSELVYLLGFDLGPTQEQRFNNVYSDTEFYKKSSATPTFTGNWIKQLITVAKKYPQTVFVRVLGENSAVIADFGRLSKRWLCDYSF